MQKLDTVVQETAKKRTNENEKTKLLLIRGLETLVIFGIYSTLDKSFCVKYRLFLIVSQPYLPIKNIKSRKQGKNNLACYNSSMKNKLCAACSGQSDAMCQRGDEENQ